MKNLLKADFYKLFKQKTFKICLIIMAVSSLLLVLFMKLPLGEDSEGATITLGEMFDITTAKDVCFDVDLTVYVAIWVALMFASEFQNGALRNAVSSGASRAKLYLSKSIVIAAAIGIAVAGEMLLKLVTGLACFGKYGGSGSIEIWYFLRALLMNVLMTVALSQCYMFIATLSRSVGGTLVLCLVVVDIVCSGFSELLSFGMLNENTEWLAKISPYILTEAQTAVSAGIGPTNTEWWWYLLTAVFNVALFVDLGIFMMNKKDLK